MKDNHMTNYEREIEEIENTLLMEGFFKIHVAFIMRLISGIREAVLKDVEKALREAKKM